MTDDGRSQPKRTRRRTLLVAAVAVVAVAAPVSVATGWPDRLRSAFDETPGDGVVTAYFARADGGGRGGVAAQQVEVDSTGDPAFDAMHAVLSAEPRGDDMVNLFAGLTDDGPFTDVASVRHEEGSITVDLTEDPWDPYPNVDYDGPTGDVLAAQVVRTAQEAYDSSDPVTVTWKGAPVRWFFAHRVAWPAG